MNPVNKIKNTVYIGIGSNVGVKINNIEYAIELIDSNPDCEVEIVSSIYESTPYGEVIQSNFFNAVFKIKTKLDLIVLFRFLKSIEKKAGRKETVKWGPREIDLDILFFNDLIYSDDEITIPHKDMLNRDFVLVPLSEIAPDFVHPVINKKICEISILMQEQNQSLVSNNKTYIIRKISHKVLI
ncbi:MAG: 2-amino-4-hydroxy-6-hydroxymethyldihydropteridine diphosphokinase [Ignavibacteriota bacterium]|nr:MAG: 2-amino-4-hydroxy-6-hydroxymethyldihydropteridine diphosphokinase [Chlorobiota bacterium]MBE7476613.1 2-amino-4-hydroxy-6-hydroxymethyldihydropteridine diphosphokinase [Ignavibacteriales bacterium]MBL1123753.1 2-amino-4-hydroxy-6-hydroxymethyldihydropteridine diphosphokinase [Ignavibacteriota bacterium]MCC7095346.1 2-amino-4-hydroxy-6-hydroxymethyldihydropteridine diphosphokinase [Ignavibacteriaceae bacterium]MCE7855640.1 2-amino-4-hydroxy-6-hydroxymethyldihydropteridine diphosphokinase